MPGSAQRKLLGPCSGGWPSAWPARAARELPAGALGSESPRTATAALSDRRRPALLDSCLRSARPRLRYAAGAARTDARACVDRCSCSSRSPSSEGCPFDFRNSPKPRCAARWRRPSPRDRSRRSRWRSSRSLRKDITACAVVGESHVALYSWPESGRLFVDVASCSTLESVRRAVAAIGARCLRRSATSTSGSSIPPRARAP